MSGCKIGREWDHDLGCGENQKEGFASELHCDGESFGDARWNSRVTLNIATKNPKTWNPSRERISARPMLSVAVRKTSNRMRLRRRTCSRKRLAPMTVAPARPDSPYRRAD